MALSARTEPRLEAFLREARVVKAFNAIFWQHLRDQGDPRLPLAERRVIFIAGGCCRPRCR